MKSLLSAVLLTMLSLTAVAPSAQADGGVALGATRVIYPADARQVSLPIINNSLKDRYLINAWVENGQEQKVKNFVVTPPLFVSEANSENTLRIVYLGGSLPEDRESVFWLNVKAIPSVEKSAVDGKNVLQLAVLSRIKLFVRPAGLGTPPENLADRLRFQRQRDRLVLNNPTPFYLSVVNLRLGSTPLANVMVPPHGNASVALPGAAQGRITFQTVNDYGGLTTSQTGVMQ
ncbi:fimbria/pilus periplasmic chaperone [Pantoea sp. 1.19]|uniref:fimbria/pilus periplasmic chaperone n=1 Tax=Pantoea sp. 1.19 TaxID=1925589 RepID=UPI000948CD92|nr:fimbria/pilus periplasmic chaperone [Pantoea sp. 1.19]